MEIEDDVALDGLSMDTSLGLLGTIKSYDIDYEKKKELGPKLTYDEVKERYFHKDLRKDVIRTQVISAFITQYSEKFHDFAVEAIDEAVLKIDADDVPDQDKELMTEILNDEFYSEVLAKKELKDKHGIE